jgi:hypothetical protein
MAERDEPRGPRRPDPDLELLRLAGPRPAVPREREERVRRTVRAYWQATVAATAAAPGHRNAARGRALIALVILAAVAPAPLALLGAVEVVTGQARIAPTQARRSPSPGWRSQRA